MERKAKALAGHMHGQIADAPTFSPRDRGVVQPGHARTGLEEAAAIKLCSPRVADRGRWSPFGERARVTGENLRRTP